MAQYLKIHLAMQGGCHFDPWWGTKNPCAAEQFKSVTTELQSLCVATREFLSWNEDSVCHN